jgi:cysteinyl-tRNA synthetase
MKIYNTLTRQKEEFVSIEEKKVKMYVCGPTVYNYIHIGNARPYVIFDTVRRYLEYKGYEVNYVQNFTDIDDKIINKANSENASVEHIANKFIEETLLDIKNLNIKNATKTPRVTEEVPEIIEMIASLIEKKYAYEKNGAVYFDTRSFVNYGKLSNFDIDELEQGARVDINSDKKNTSDFILWKPSKKDEPKWTSAWGDGRPGWHIECSAMVKKYLGDTIDIHAGGEDLIFPHHENEIAQSEANSGKKLANYWIHNGFVNVENQKMSKSKDNFFTLRDIANKFSHEVIRFYILSAHYRSPINFSEELMISSESSLNRIKNCINNLNFILENIINKEITSSEQKLLDETKQFKINFELYMDDDFNTSTAISVIFDYVKFANINLSETSSNVIVKHVHDEIIYLCSILGIIISKKIIDVDELEINELIAKRETARANRDFATADKIRNVLKEMDIVIEDTSTGVRWSYVNV